MNIIKKIIKEEVSKIFNSMLGENYPTGTSEDINAPWNQKDLRSGIKSENNLFKLKLWHQDIAIFEKSGKYYSFCVDCFEKSDYAEYADREEAFMGRDEDGDSMIDFGDWEMSDDIIENFVNDNYSSFRIGKGYSDWENGLEMVEIDQEMLDEFKAVIKYIKNTKLQKSFIDFFHNINLS